MNDELVKRHVEQLRLTGGDLADLCQPLADAIEALTAERDRAEDELYELQQTCITLRGENEALIAERDGLLRCVTDNHVALCRAEKAEADFARQVQRTDEQREAYEQALSVMEAERDRLREALWAILACETPNANATVTRMASIAKAALKGETP